MIALTIIIRASLVFAIVWIAEFGLMRTSVRVRCTTEAQTKPITAAVAWTPLGPLDIVIDKVLISCLFNILTA